MVSRSSASGLLGVLWPGNGSHLPVRVRSRVSLNSSACRAGSDSRTRVAHRRRRVSSEGALTHERLAFEPGLPQGNRSLSSGKSSQPDSVTGVSGLVGCVCVSRHPPSSSRISRNWRNLSVRLPVTAR